MQMLSRPSDLGPADDKAEMARMAAKENLFHERLCLGDYCSQVELWESISDEDIDNRLRHWDDISFPED